MNDQDADDEMVALTADIVSAYVSNNPVQATDLGNLIGVVHNSLSALASGQLDAAAEPLIPAVPIKRSVHDDHIVCLEDGKKFKSLRRHLSAVFNMTPDEYRQKWNLPASYPMVAPGYSAQRSALAKKLGLGRKSKVDPAKRGRGKVR